MDTDKKSRFAFYLYPTVLICGKNAFVMGCRRSVRRGVSLIEISSACRASLHACDLEKAVDALGAING